MQDPNRVLVRGIRQLLTLRGPGGPRCGAAAQNLGVISDASLLLKDGVVERAGKARAVEGTKEARTAREVQARGAVILPGLVEPDAMLTPPEPGMPRAHAESAAVRGAAELTRYGYTAAGAHTTGCEKPTEAVRALRALRSLHLRPLRLRPVVSLPPMEHRQAAAETTRWLAAVQKRRLSLVAEISAGEPGSDSRSASACMMTAAVQGFVARLRLGGPPDEEVLRQAARAGVIAVTAAAGTGTALQPLGHHFVHVIPCSPLMQEAAGISRRTGDGVAPAISSGYSAGERSTLNPQLLLYLGCSRLGLTMEEAITAMTWNAACALRMSGSAGCIEPGRGADLAAFDVSDYRELARRAGNADVVFTMQAGRLTYLRGGAAANR